MKLGRVAIAGASGIMGLGLLGVGAHAAFTTSTASSQTITAGAPKAVTWSATATNGCTTKTIATANPTACQSVTLNPVGPVGSTFETTLAKIYVANVGNIPITETGFQLTDTTSGPNTSGNFLQNQMDVCLASDPGSAGAGGSPEDHATIVGNGPLTTGLALSPSVALFGPKLTVGGTDEYQTDFYAGKNSAECGTIWSTGPHTASAWSGTTYPNQTPWVTPASLTSQAEGGSVTVTFTLSYAG